MEASARTIVSPQRFPKRNMLHFVCSAVPAQRQNNRTATGLRLPFQASENVMDLEFKIFDSDRLITEMEVRPALYNWLTD